MIADAQQVGDWVDRLFGEAPGSFVVNFEPAAGKFVGSGGQVSRGAIVDRVLALDHDGAKGIYLRATTINRQLDPWARGGASDSYALPGLWADVDFGTLGHKIDEEKQLPLPPNEEEARLIVETSGLPAPSLWVHSGGGFYPWWLLDQPVLIDDSIRKVVGDVSAQWQQTIQQSAERLGYHYGTGVGDLARVLRIPGTINRKAGAERPCRIVEDNGTIYPLAQLLTAVTPKPLPTRPPVALPTVWDNARGPGAFDLLDEHVTFDDILTSAGWTIHTSRHGSDIDQCWTRPGNPEHACSAHTLKVNPHVLVVWSDAAGLPAGAGRRLTRGRLFAELHHRGDTRAAALDIFAARRGEGSAAAASLPIPKEATVTTLPKPAAKGEGEGWVAPTPSLQLQSVRELRAEVAAQGPRKWLLKGLWPGGDYGVLGAEKKAQKTWNTTDLAVAVASGTPWLGLVEVETPGPVVMFVGEGGKGNTLRRLDAAAEERGIDLDDLPIYVCAKAPHLNNIEHLELFRQWVQQIRPAVVTLDPLYLAARGAELGDLYKMGALLETPQHICQETGASLFVVHHFNRQAGTGASRLSGAGPAEWGRVLLAVSIKSKHTDPETRASRVITEMEAIGGEIADLKLRIDRKVWADDPDDLDTPLHTTTIMTWADDDAPAGEREGEKLTPAQTKLLEAIDAIVQGSQTDLVDVIVERHGHGLRRETVSRELNKLQAAGLVDCVEHEGGSGRFPMKIWFRSEAPCDPCDVTRDEHTVTDRVTRVTAPIRSQVHVTGSRSHGEEDAQDHTVKLTEREAS